MARSTHMHNRARFRPASAHHVRRDHRRCTSRLLVTKDSILFSASSCAFLVLGSLRVGVAVTSARAIRVHAACRVRCAGPRWAWQGRVLGISSDRSDVQA